MLVDAKCTRFFFDSPGNKSRMLSPRLPPLDPHKHLMCFWQEGPVILRVSMLSPMLPIYTYRCSSWSWLYLLTVAVRLKFVLLNLRWYRFNTQTHTTWHPIVVHSIMMTPLRVLQDSWIDSGAYPCGSSAFQISQAKFLDTAGWHNSYSNLLSFLSVSIEKATILLAWHIHFVFCSVAVNATFCEREGQE